MITRLSSIALAAGLCALLVGCSGDSPSPPTAVCVPPSFEGEWRLTNASAVPETGAPPCVASLVISLESSPEIAAEHGQTSGTISWCGEAYPFMAGTVGKDTVRGRELISFQAIPLRAGHGSMHSVWQFFLELAPDGSEQLYVLFIGIKPDATPDGQFGYSPGLQYLRVQ